VPLRSQMGIVHFDFQFMTRQSERLTLDPGANRLADATGMKIKCRFGRG